MASSITFSARATTVALTRVCTILNVLNSSHKIILVLCWSSGCWVSDAIDPCMCHNATLMLFTRELQSAKFELQKYQSFFHVAAASSCTRARSEKDNESNRNTYSRNINQPTTYNKHLSAAVCSLSDNTTHK